MSLDLLLNPNPWLGPFYMSSLYVDNLDATDFSGTLNIGVAKVGSLGRINIGAVGVPVYIDGVLYNSTTSSINTPVTFTVSAGTYTGGVGTISLRKSGDWVDLVLVQTTLGTGSGYSGSPISVVNALPVGYRPSIALTFQLQNLTGSNEGTCILNTNGTIDMIPLLGWSFDPSGLENAFSCSYTTA